MSDFPPAGMSAGQDSKHFTVTQQDNSVSTTTEDGYVVSRPRSTRLPGREFSTGFTEISNADKALLEAFWQSVKGNADIFTWDDPTTGQTLNVRFKGQADYRYVGIGGNHQWNVIFKLQEV